MIDMNKFETHMGQGIGKYIKNEISNATNYVKICTPNISHSLCEELFPKLDKGLRIKIITSDIITGEKDSPQAKSLAKKIIKEKKNGSNLEYKTISTFDIPMIHAKIFIIDNKCAIIGSANFTENSFQNFVEFILITRDVDVIKMIEDDYDEFWNEIDSYPNQVINKSLKNTIRDLKKKI
jgi:phosphatidylserine/phosphatidylglycerophosphate/cardiolipin synthase-like enzyme